MPDQNDESVRQQFPDITDEELAQARTDVQGAAATIAARTGDDVNDVRSRLESARRS